MSEHVEVLERLRGVLEHGRMEGKRMISTDLVEKAIAALSATAEAQPVAWRIDWSPAYPETWELTSDGGRLRKIQELSRPPHIQPLYAHPPPSAPVGVEGLLELADEIERQARDCPTVDWRPNAFENARKLRALAQQPAAVPKRVEEILAEMREEGQSDIVDGGIVLEWEDDMRAALTHQYTAVGDGASLDAERMETIKRMRFGVVPVEGGGWDVYVYDADGGKETLISSAKDVRHAIDEAIAAQQGGES